MYVLRFFLNTLLLVVVVVGGVLGFIYRDEVMHKTTLLSRDVMAVLYEQGWLATSPFAKQEDVTELPRLSTSSPLPTSALAPVLVMTPPSQPAAVLPPSIPPVGTSAKADYPSNDYSPADPGSEAQNRPADKSTFPPPPALPPSATLSKENVENVPSNLYGSSSAQIPHGISAVSSGEQSMPAFDSHRAGDVTVPFGNASSPPVPLTESREQALGSIPSYPFPQPSAIPSLIPDESKQSEQNISDNRDIGELQVTKAIPLWLNRQDVPSLTSPSLVGPQARPTMPSQLAIDEGRQQALRTQPSIALREAWMTARRLFWEQEPATAEKAYQALIRDYPDEPDLPGELGNMYLNQGRWQEAAELYYEAGIRALHVSNRGQVNAVIRILRQLDPAKAEVLWQNMTASHAPR